MKDSRRDFLKKAALGSGVLATGGWNTVAGNSTALKPDENQNIPKGNIPVNKARANSYTTYLQDNKTKWLADKTCDFKQAEWIGLPGNAEKKHPYFLARKEFEIESQPSGAYIHVSADLFYKLYINGQFIDFGPTRDTQIIMTYRVFEISRMLQTGANVIAIEVYQNRYPVHIHRHLQGSGHKNMGKHESPAADRMACICQLDLTDNSGEILYSIGTGKDWKVMAGEAWNPRGLRSSFFSQAEVYDCQKEPEGWKLAGFDDSSWQPPGPDPVLESYKHIKKGKRPHTRLENCTVPPVQRDLLLPALVHATGEVSQLENVLNIDIGTKMTSERLEEIQEGQTHGLKNITRENGYPVIIQNGYPYYDRENFYRQLDEGDDLPVVRDVSIILDFGELMNGHFLLDIETDEKDAPDFLPQDPMFTLWSEGKDRKGMVDIAWAQELVNGRVIPRLYPSDPHPEGSGFDHSHALRFMMKKGRQTWENFHYHQFRYVQITFRNLTGPVKLHRFGAIRTTAPFEVKGLFKSSDPVLNWAWEASHRTIQLCTHDNCMDNIVRERGLYQGDTGLGFITTIFSTCGNEPFSRNFIRMFCEQPEDNRFLRMDVGIYVSEKETKPDILMIPLWMAWGMCQYIGYTDDDDFTRKIIYPALEALANYYISILNGNGMIEDPTGWQFIDWADCDNRSGEVAPQSLLLAAFLTELSNICNFLDKPKKANYYLEKVNKIKDYVYNHFWNEEAGLYVDSLKDGKQRTSLFSEHANSYALINGLGKNKRGDRIVKNLFHYDKRLVQAEIASTKFVLKGLFKAGYDKVALELMQKRLNRLYRRGIDTFPEEWSYRSSVRESRWIARWRSLAQSAACVPAYILSSEVIGIKPVDFGCKKVNIQPKMELLEWAEGRCPTPHGDIKVNWKKREGKTSLNVEIPKGTEAIMMLPPNMKYRGEITGELNGNLVEYKIKGGKHGFDEE